MLKLSAKNLLRANIGESETHEIQDDLTSLDMPESIEPHQLAGSVKLTRLEDSILVSGNFSAKLTLICDRCLDNFETEIKFPLDREFMLDRKDADEEVLVVDKYLDIDLGEEVRQELLLAIPSQNFCRPDCRGICPTCGENLNHEECKCKIRKAS